jgi:hypothetical protein
MARLDPCLPLIAEGVWEQHQRCDGRPWFDGHALIDWLNEGHTDTPHGDGGATRDVSAWDGSPRTRLTLERWMARHCSGRLARLAELAWATSSDPSWMLAHLCSIPEHRPGSPTARKLRLFACAAVRSAWGGVPDAPCRHAVEVAERFADGLAGEEELAAAREAAMRACQGTAGLAGELAEAVHSAAASDAALAAWNAAAQTRRVVATASWLQCDLLRDIFGPTPSRPPAVDPAWLAWDGGVVLGLAAAAYENRLPDGRLDPARLAVLADALLDAGCTSAELTGHLRGAGPHAPGCFVVDLILGLR